MVDGTAEAPCPLRGAAVRPLLAGLVTIALVVASTAAHAAEVADGTGWSVTLPPGFQKQFDSCSGDGG